MGGKFATLHFSLQDTWANELNLDSEEVLVSYVADEVIYQMQLEGMNVTYPAGIDPQMACKESDYPPLAWNRAEEIWGAMAPTERADFRGQIEAQRSEVMQAGFKESFGIYDLLFFGLAMVTAFRLASRPGAG